MPAARPDVRCSAFVAKSGTKACRPTGFGGASSTIRMIVAACSVRSSQ
ncbi:hypothetical protein NSERUTF1_1927 [Nocardia seriolae]|nr:hypothetical protein NSERUTF1_1927 [Nocardia seriolae]